MENYDEKAGIYYGVLPPQLCPAALLQEIQELGDNQTFVVRKEAVVNKLKEAINVDKLKEVLGELLAQDETWEEVHYTIAENIFETWAADENWEPGEQDGYVYGHAGYVMELFYLGGAAHLMVKSAPFFTYVRPCSPCCPNAGDLGSPDEMGIKTYCLEHAWFEDGKAPYPIYRVDRPAKEVAPEK